MSDVEARRSGEDAWVSGTPEATAVMDYENTAERSAVEVRAFRAGWHRASAMRPRPGDTRRRTRPVVTERDGEMVTIANPSGDPACVLVEAADCDVLAAVLVIGVTGDDELRWWTTTGFEDDLIQAAAAVEFSGIDEWTPHAVWDGRRRQVVASRLRIERHVQSHPHVCDCGRRFGTERGLTMHRARSRLHRKQPNERRKR